MPVGRGLSAQADDGLETAEVAAALPDVSGSLTAANEQLLTTLIASSTPVGTTPNVANTPTGASIPSAISGELNAVVVSAPQTDSVVTVPGGYKFDYLTGGNATLTGNPFSVLIGASPTSTLRFSGGDTVIGGNGFNTFFSTEDQNTSNDIYGGSGQNLFYLASADVVTSQGTDTIIGVGNDTVTASGSLLYFGNGGESALTVTGASTLVGFAGGLTLGGPSALVFDDNATTIQMGSGTATIIGTQGGLGGTTLNGGSGAALYFGTANLTYVGGSAVDTLVGTGGSIAATIGSAGALAFGAGTDTITANSGALTYIGFHSAAITLGGAGANLIALPAGDIDASKSSGSNTFFDNGSVSILGGSGPTAIVAGSGNSTLNPGSGLTLIVIGEITNANRTFVINDFNGAQDFINLAGYAAGADAAAFQSAVVSSTPAGSDTTVTLLDGTKIVFQNPQNLAGFSFR